MADKPSKDEIQLLRRLKTKLISILSVQADFVLQHADSCSLVTPQVYRQINSCRIPDEKIRDLLDHIIERGPEVARGLLQLLKNQDLQETFPMLNLIKFTQADTCAENKAKQKKTRWHKRKLEIHEDTDLHQEQVKRFSPVLVTEKQLMTVARALGQSWKEVAITALEVPSVKLEQIVADNPNCQVNQVFAALRYWRNIQGNRATVSCLYSLLSQPDLALSQEAFNFLLE